MKEDVTTSNTYETDELISQYLEFHYGEKYFGVENFPKACIDTIFKHSKGVHFERALDIGCAVGRSSFELAKKIGTVDALDYSHSFINSAKNLAEQGKADYSIVNEGDLSTNRQVLLDALGLMQTVNHVTFSQGDASNLEEKHKDYDLIFAGNLIDRLNEPSLFLRNIDKRINSKGLLVLTSPYTWLEEFTLKKNWIGGYRLDGKEITTLEGLNDILLNKFDSFCAPVDVPFVIRETARKHQHTIAQMTFWQKKEA